MRNTFVIFKRELAGYFSTPVAYVFIVIFLMLNGIMSFYLGGLFERGQADLMPFFYFHPWLYLVLIPAISMRLWSEERKSGTVELLMTLPVSTAQAVTGKFLAAWVFTGIALALTFPTWLTVSYLGDPDQMVILSGYVGSFLMAGAFLAIGSCISAITRNQVISFVISVIVCLLFVASGEALVIEALRGFAPQWALDTISNFSFQQHFLSIMRGLIDARDIIFFGSLMVCCLFANAILIDQTKAN